MKNFLLISALLSTAFLAGCGTTAVQPEAKTTGQAPQATACTMDAKACPDGSYVGRTGPNCEFAPCPTTNTGEAVSCGITPSASCGTGK
ncbi:MAG: hypothetical protein WCO66_05045 [Candidatus Absconditabacteria bacterium]